MISLPSLPKAQPLIKSVRSTTPPRNCLIGITTEEALSGEGRARKAGYPGLSGNGNRVGSILVEQTVKMTHNVKLHFHSSCLASPMFLLPPQERVNSMPHPAEHMSAHPGPGHDEWSVRCSQTGPWKRSPAATPSSSVRAVRNRPTPLAPRPTGMTRTAGDATVSPSG